MPVWQEQFVDLVERSSRECFLGEISRSLSIFAWALVPILVLGAVRGHYAGRRLMLILLKDRGCGCRYLAAAHEGCSCCGLSHEADCVGVGVILDYLHTTILKLMLLY